VFDSKKSSDIQMLASSFREDFTAGLRGSVAPCLRLAVLFFLVAFGVSTAQGQASSVRIEVLSTSPARVRVSGEAQSPAKTWAFRNAYAGMIGIGERVEKLSLTDARGETIAAKKTAPGEYEAESATARFSYEVKVEAPTFTTDSAYISWLTPERGFLMLGDLLPRTVARSAPQSLKVSFALPSGWSVFSNETKGADGNFLVTEPDAARFFVGRDLRERRTRAGSVDFSLVAAGDWAFTDEDVAEAAQSILKEHERTMGGPPAKSSVMLMLSPYPRPLGAERWSAETRGGSVVLLSGRQPSKVAGLALLSTPLTHELFHLWVPNALSLDGSYDWFYEGFTLYQAMRAGMRLGMLTFDDYLRAMGRANDIYLSSNDRDKWSLVEASERRWTGTTALIYNKGMLVAFLYDLYLRQQSNGKRSLDNVYRELFKIYGPSGARREGNSAVIAALGGDGAEMREFVRRYIESPVAIDLKSGLAPYGLEILPGGVRTHVSVVNSLNSRQRDLLRQLGYNERVERDRRAARPR
jgi:predicted metalloprotease with PDZ domain